MSETEQEVPIVTLTKPIYLTMVTVAGNRLSDLIDALKQMDPDLHTVTGEVCRNGTAVLAYSVRSTSPPHRL